MKLVGKVRDAHGLKGELFIHIPSGDISWMTRLEKFYLKSKLNEEDEVQTFSVQKLKPFKTGLIVKAEEVADRNASESLKSFDFYIDDELLVSNEGETIYLGEILNFKLKNPAQELQGTVVGFSSNGVQDLLVVETLKGKKAEVPFVEAFIKRIDFKQETLVMELPEGLLNIDEV